MIKNKYWVIYIYIVFLVTIFLTIISFISNYIFWNLDIYNTIKWYFSLYWNQLWLNEQIVVDYYDNPKNISYIDSKYYNKDKFISRYKDKIEYNLDSSTIYQLSLTSADEEYNNNLSKLKFIDLYWNTDDNKCDINISLIRWKKDKIGTLINNKKILNYLDNLSLLSWTIWNDKKTLDIKFSTWAYYNSWNLVTSNFVTNNTINSISWLLNQYTLDLNNELDLQVVNTIELKENQVKDINWRFFDADNIVIRTNDNIYRNRYRIKDSFWYIDKLNFEYKILINSNNDCPFLVEWFDSDNKIVKIPDNNIKWELTIKELNTKIDIVKKVKIWNIELSNYLYKFY